jgi:UDP-N-acetyl-2-amino-2-deoxyglucuronate dehydrogenase
MNFAIIGVAGYAAPKHLKAISDTGNTLSAAIDPHDSVGILDQYSFDIKFFTEIECFDEYLESLRRGPEEARTHYVSICSPNYLHTAHCRLALRLGADAICEKPLVIHPKLLDVLREAEEETGRRINTVLQLRLHPKLIALKERLLEQSKTDQHNVNLTYITARGNWYYTSWKGFVEKSGGIASNIGIHFFDLLLWLFGSVGECRVHYADQKRMAGFLELERARVKWFLSIDSTDLPPQAKLAQQTTYRSITLNGEEIEFSSGIATLHTETYKRILEGQGFGIEDVRSSTELVYRIRKASLSSLDDTVHPYLTHLSL